jgi:PTS system ascorbate-specific IIA component
MQSKSPVSVGIDNIRIGLKADDWEDAIRQASDPLVGSGAIRGSYVDSMINSVKELGPYIVLMPGFALAHAAPSSEVLRTDISIAVFDSPVFFASENDPVFVVMCLACKDKASHLERLQRIARKFLDDAHLVRRIRECKTRDELSTLLNE